MSKLLTITTGLLLLGLSAIAQKYEPFISETKQWKYVYDLGITGTSGSTSHSVEMCYFNGETDFSNTKYHNFNVQTTQPTVLAAQVLYYFREDTTNQKVYVYDPAFSDSALIYDFKLAKNDIFNIFLSNGQFEEHTVVKVDYVTLLSKKLKRIVFNDSTTWIEGVGCTTSTTIPSPGYLMCVKESASVLYLGSNYQNCDTIFSSKTANETLESNNRLSIYPNPIESSSVLEIKNPTNEQLKIELFNSMGVLVKTDYFINQYAIGAIPLTKGMYLCRISKLNETISVEKFIVE